jgi:hypothetical protein
MPAPYTGGCQCGSVRYVLTAEPIRSAVLKSAQEVLSVKPGTLDDTSWLRPGYFIWMKSAQGWVPVPDGVNAVEGQT